jgi:hypothetical protein
MRHTTRFLVASMFLCAVAAARAADLRLEATLVWGTDDEKPPANCKAVEADLAVKLHGMFRWKNYFEITHRIATVPKNQTRDLKMSEHCTLQVRNLGASRVEINCIGRGKPVYKDACTLVPPKWFVLAGDAANETAWFVALRSSPSKSADSNKVVSEN